MRNSLAGIAGWQKNSLIDFPGSVATVLFFSFCNLRCPYCHNPTLLDTQELQSIDENEVWSFLEKRRNLIDGVVLSGGEPTLHPNLPEAASEMKSMGYRIKLDTNGLIPDMIDSIAPDYLALDLKTIPANYLKLLGATYPDIENRLMRSISIVKKMNKNAEVRITCAPEIIDEEIIKSLGRMLDGVEIVYLQPMQNKVPLLDKEFAKRELIKDEEIWKYREILGEWVGRCEVRGKE